MGGLGLRLLAAAPWLAAVQTPPPGPVQLPSPSPSATPQASQFGAGVIGFSFLLSLLVWGPVLMALAAALFPRGLRGRFDRVPFGIAFWSMAGSVVLTLIGYSQFQSFTSGLQFEEKLPWLPSIGVDYHLGVDGVGITVLVLEALVGLCAVIASWDVRERPRQYFCLLLLAQSAVTGTVVARDFFVLFLFWAAAIVPVALLVAGWSGPRGPGAARRLLAYWGLGSAALLAGGLLLYQAAGATDFDLASLAKAQPSSRLQFVVAVLVLLAAASRLPLLPLHGWAGEVFSAAPAGVAVHVAGASTRLGGYLLVELVAGSLHTGSRLIAPYVGVVAGVTVIWAALGALRSSAVRRVAAYLALIPGAVTALGLAGLSPLSLHGMVLSLFAGGLAAALLVGAAATLAERAQTDTLGLAAGLAGRMPVLSWLFVLGAMATLGIPFGATFASGLMIFLGSIKNQPGAVFLVAAGLVLAAVAVAWLLHRALFGAPNPEAPQPADATLSEKWYLGILLGGLLWVGLVPGGPKLFGIPLFDPGMINVVNSAAGDLASSYAPSPPPNPTPSPSASPAPAPTPAPSPSP